MTYSAVDWESANCAGTDLRQWFPAHGAATRTVKRICDECYIQESCLRWALDNGEVGFWGGRYFAQRKGDNGQSEYVHLGSDGGDVSDVPTTPA